LSRKSSPKQFLKVLGEKSLFQMTVQRLGEIGGMENVYVVCSADYADLVLSQAPGLGDEQVIVEPAPRNTAPCIGLAASYLAARFPDELMGVFPSDHLIQDEKEFRRVLASASNLARSGYLVTFGIRPEFPATGYGYLEQGEEIPGKDGVMAFKVVRFTEKPDLETAERFRASGRYCWNSGMFVWSLAAILNAIREHMPDLDDIIQRLGDCRGISGKGRELFEKAAPVSIDYGVMEKSEDVVVIPCDLQWSDVGDWNAVAEILARRGSATGSGTVVEVDSRNCFVHSDSGKTVALAGVENLIIVETGDSIMICSRSRSQDVGKIVEILKRQSPELI